jgi:hypothetical protein
MAARKPTPDVLRAQKQSTSGYGTLLSLALATGILVGGLTWALLGVAEGSGLTLFWLEGLAISWLAQSGGMLGSGEDSGAAVLAVAGMLTWGREGVRPGLKGQRRVLRVMIDLARHDPHRWWTVREVHAHHALKQLDRDTVYRHLKRLVARSEASRIFRRRRADGLHEYRYVARFE